MTLLILNGPNLNLLGTREPDTYGAETLADVEDGLRTTFPEIDFSFRQDNSEGALIDHLHAAHAHALDGVVFNPWPYETPWRPSTRRWWRCTFPTCTLAKPSGINHASRRFASGKSPGLEPRDTRSPSATCAPTTVDCS